MTLQELETAFEECDWPDEMVTVAKAFAKEELEKLEMVYREDEHVKEGNSIYPYSFIQEAIKDLS